MRQYFTNKRAMFLVSAVILGSGFTRWNSFANVPPCINSPSCQSEERGKLTDRQHGYPLTYAQKLTFEPDDKNTYATASTESYNYINILINTIFWFALIELLYQLYNTRKTTDKNRLPRS